MKFEDSFTAKGWHEGAKPNVLPFSSTIEGWLGSTTPPLGRCGWRLSPLCCEVEHQHMADSSVGTQGSASPLARDRAFSSRVPVLAMRAN